MIKKIEIMDMRSIKNAVISFEKSGIEYRQKYVFREKYVNPLTLYGDNGSGKSMILYAIQQLVLIMNYDESFTKTHSAVFPDILLLSKLNNKKGSSTTNIEIPTLRFSFVTKDYIEFTYEVKSIFDNIYSEQLFVKGFNDDKPILFRNREKFKIAGEQFEIIRETYSAVRLIGIEEYVEKNTFKSLIKKCFECMRDVIYIDSSLYVFGHKFIKTKTPTDIMLESDFVATHLSKFSSLPQLKHVKKSNYGEALEVVMDFGNDKHLPLNVASDGIVREGLLFAALKAALEEEDAVVAIDEINRSIHPLNIKNIVDEFVQKGIQLVFSSHDTSLLKYLRPDQVYFSYLKSNIESVYCRLNELHPNIRDINNIESMYLKGVFDEKLQKCNE